MITKFKMNCRDVYDTSISYLEFKNNLEDIQKELKDISDGISSSWIGGDSTIFNENLKVHIESFKEVIDFMDYQALKLKDNSTNHSQIEEEFNEELKRSEKYEYED